jgi:RNA polymerase sigma factor (sigma-70 family)
MIRVLLVDDHPSPREPLTFMLERKPDVLVVAEAGSLAEARRLLLAGVDVAVVDLALPDGDGSDLIRELRVATPLAAVLVLTDRSDRTAAARAVAAGAAGVLHKSIPTADIVAAVRRLYANEPRLTPAEAKELDRLGRAERQRESVARQAIASLTPREREVLQALAAGLSNKEIGLKLHVSTETVRRHVAHIFRKLGVDSRLHALAFAVRHRLVDLD